jgi:hypothetical protein
MLRLGFGMAKIVCNCFMVSIALLMSHAGMLRLAGPLYNV